MRISTGWADDEDDSRDENSPLLVVFAAEEDVEEGVNCEENERSYRTRPPFVKIVK